MVKGYREINFKSSIPLQLQVRDIILGEILSRKLVDEAGKIATEYELMERFGVSRVTIRNALQMLIEEGIIIRERGKGTFVRSDYSENWTGRLLGFTEIIKASGFEPGAEIIRSGAVAKNDHHFNICVENLNTSDIWNLTRLRFADDHTAAIEYAFLPLSYGERMKDQNLESIAIYQFLEEALGLHLKEANQVISAVNADTKTANLLNVQVGEALLHTERMTKTSQGEPAEYLEAIYRPDYFQYLINVSKNGI